MNKQQHVAMLCENLVRISLLAFAISQHGISAAACVDNCTESSLYESENSPLSFTLYQLRELSETRRSSPVVRHEYQIILTQGKTQGKTQKQTQRKRTSENQDYKSLTVYDALAQAHTFRQLKDGRFKALATKSGSLKNTRAGYVWKTPEKVEYHFMGSRLQTISYPSGQNLTLTYNNDQLARITDDTGKSLGLLYDQQRLVSLKKPDGTYSAVKLNRAAFKSRSQDECKSENSPPEQPDTKPSDDPSPPSGQQTDIPLVQPDATQPVVEPAATENHCKSESASPHIFQTPFSNALQTTMIDARPASCESYFVEFYGTVRGFEIEAGLAVHAPYNTMQPTIRVFPVIDFIDGGDLYVVHSRDLGSSSYNSEQNPEALLNALLAEGREIRQSFLEPISQHGQISATELGQQTIIHAEDVDSITLQMIIRDGIASPAHWLQIKTAREQLLLEYGIELQIVVIP